MKKELAPEVYNYNKFPGPSFARVGDKVVSENIELDLVLEHKSAFDQTVFGQRFSQLLLKFDYIVGDWGNEQLRLKGFYKDEKLVPNNRKISRLEDYLTEFCNFGCAYFVLENPNPQSLPVEKEEKPRRKKTRKRKTNRPKMDRHFTVSEKKTSQTNSKKSRPTHSTNHSSESKKHKREFIIRQK